MAEITGYRPRGASLICVCTKCAIVVAPDRDTCPNDEGDGGEVLRRQLRNDPDAHYLVTYVLADDAQRRIDEALGLGSLHRTLNHTAQASIEAAEAALQAAKVALRRD